MDVLISFLAAVIQAGTPLLFATLGETITEKAGNLNLGVEGMMLMGAVVGFQIGLSTASPILAIVGALLAGAFGALVFAFLTVTLRANQVVSGLSLTIFGTGFAGFLGARLVGENTPEALREFFRPLSIPFLSDIPFIGPVLFRHDILVYSGIIAAIISGIYLYNTRKGLNLRSIGENPAAADATGIHVSLYKYIHIMIGGALCGLGGAYLSLVSVHTWQDGITAGRGWIAVALVIFVAWNPYKAIFGAFLFGALDIVGFYMQNNEHISRYISISQYLIDMLPYLVTILVLVVTSIKKSKENAPPLGLGNPYFREDR